MQRWSARAVVRARRSFEQGARWRCALSKTSGAAVTLRQQRSRLWVYGDARANEKFKSLQIEGRSCQVSLRIFMRRGGTTASPVKRLSFDLEGIRCSCWNSRWSDLRFVQGWMDTSCFRITWVLLPIFPRGRRWSWALTIWLIYSWWLNVSHDIICNHVTHFLEFGILLSIMLYYLWATARHAWIRLCIFTLAFVASLDETFYTVQIKKHFL